MTVFMPSWFQPAGMTASNDPVAASPADPDRALPSQELLINMGPQHPSTHGVLHLRVRTDGEIVTDVEPRIGYLHRCAEKIAEKVTYAQYVPYTDRLDYLAGTNCNLGYCLAVERLAGIEAPERARWIRVILAELNRIASHLIAFGTFGLDTGAFTPFLYAFRERELILDLIESYAGARLTTHDIRIGGVPRDLDADLAGRIRKFLDVLGPKIRDYHELLSYNAIFIARTAGVGILPPDVAIAYGVTGPCLRASGVGFDLRRDEPYGGYDRFRFEVPVGHEGPGRIGDSWNRYFVRIREMEESASIVRQALDGLPPGPFAPLNPKRPIKPPAGESYVRTESPRGLLGFYLVSAGGDRPVRCKIRAPSFSNLAVLPGLSKGMMLADLVAILGSLDIVLGEIDR
jgi:NADH-quinone oxidoreductase subunit D